MMSALSSLLATYYKKVLGSQEFPDDLLYLFCCRPPVPIPLDFSLSTFLFEVSCSPLPLLRYRKIFIILPRLPFIAYYLCNSSEVVVNPYLLISQHQQ